MRARSGFKGTQNENQLELSLFQFQTSPASNETLRSSVFPPSNQEEFKRELLRPSFDPPPSPPQPTSTAPPTKEQDAPEEDPRSLPSPAEAPVRNPNNHRISDSDRLGSGSPKRKCRQNLSAIRLLQKIESEKRPATREEKQSLTQFVGWGGLPQVFDSANEQWRAEREELESILSPDELASARATTLNAHYTSAVVIRAIYTALQRFGFEGGRILEPALGIGHFIGLMPGEMHARSHITGIEIDSVSTRIARALYPDCDLRHQPFEEAKLADEFYDVAVSNIPFGNYRPFDPRLKSWKFLIHDYFFAAALQKVRPGAIVAFITSRGTLDKSDPVLREFVEHQADFLGAFRLPNDAFKRNANTEVTTDVVMLRKRLPGELPSGERWREIVPITNSVGETIAINEYFAARPEMMLGEMRLAGRMYQRGEPTLVGNGVDLGERLATALASLPKDIYRPLAKASPSLQPAPSYPAPSDVKPNAFALLNGQIGIRTGDTMRVLTSLPLKTSQRIRGMIRVRDAVRLCLASQLTGADEAEIVSARAGLNHAYDNFIVQYGPLSTSANASAFRSDPDFPLLLSLERYDPETGQAEKASIFTERTIRPPPSPPFIQTAQDALLLTLNLRGTVDLDQMAELLRQKTSAFLPELKGAIFHNPQTGGWETDDQYLSGNVRAKLAAAEAAALLDHGFVENVEALKFVQPTDLTASEIDARLGSTWVPPEDIQQFAEELLGEKGVHVSHTPELGLWVVRAGWTIKASMANTTEWGTDRRNAVDLLEDALNLRTPTVYDRDPVTDRDMVNGPATEAARDKQEKIKGRFQEWIWQDDTRRERFVRIYNQEFNNIRLREFNGDHLTLPGASPSVILRKHQKAAVWRILQTPNCLLAHVVGAGKTYTMVAAALELKRLGLAKKSLFVVPNHMLGQFSAELLTLYPGANILVATREDLEKAKRQTLMSRIATGNWDAVIVTHAGFEKIGVALATQQEFFHEQLRDLSLALEKQRQEEDSRTVKILERAKKRLETQLKELSNSERKDPGLTFEELGVDRLFVD